MKRLVIGWSVLSALVVCGCGPARDHATIRVEGTLAVDGKAPGALMLRLTPQGGEDMPTVNGYVETDGSFKLTTYEDGDGAPVGKYKVSLGPHPMSPGNVPSIKDAVVEITSSSGDAPLKIELESTGAMTSPLPRPGMEGGKSGGGIAPGMPGGT